MTAVTGQPSGGGVPSPPFAKAVAKLDGLPKDREVETYGGGGGTPTEIKGGPLDGWWVGGEKRSDVCGNTSHPSTPAPKTLPWGFIPIATTLDIDNPSDTASHLYYQSFPQNVTRPGGELVEITITQTDVTPPYSFVSDNYTVGQVSNTLNDNCFGLTISDPILLNSTGNIRRGSVLQYYRGDSAAILLRGYEDAQGLPGNLPFPPSVNATTWACLNSTIASSIPLMSPPGYHFPWWGVLLITFGIVAFCCCGYYGYTHGYFNLPKSDDDGGRYTRLPEPTRGHRRRRGQDPLMTTNV